MWRKVVTQYSERVRLHKLKMDSEVWGKQVNYIHAHNGVMEICYNNGNVKYEQIRNTGDGVKKGKIWWEYSEKSNEGLINDFRRHLTDWNWKGRDREE